MAIDFDYAETKNLAFLTEDHIRVFQSSDDILRTSRGGGLTYTFRNSFYVTHNLRAEYRKNGINDEISALNPNYYGDEKTSQQFGTLTYQFTDDHRDYAAYPLRGYFLNFYLSKLGLTPKDDVQKLEAMATGSIFLDLSNQFYLSNNTVFTFSTPNDLPYANYSVLGFRNQLVRGYEIYVIEGPWYSINKTTFKKRIFSRTYNWNFMPINQFKHIPISVYLKGYGDVGYVRNYANYTNIRLSNKLLTGVGGGLDIVGSYDLVIRLEYTFNGEGDKGFFFHIKKEF